MGESNERRIVKLRNKKTGKTWVLEHISILDEPVLYTNGRPLRQYTTIAELNEEWEDYKPAEPLIKDEKIRKAVRAWAEAEKIRSVYYKVPDTFESIDGTARIEFGAFGFEEGRYTIEELCGEIE